MSSQSPPPGWYPDPQNPGQNQWWDGEKWTGHVAPRTGPPAPTPAQPVSTSAVVVPNYLPQAILVTIFCCWPFGIPAIVFAAQVNQKLGQGDIAGAQESSRKAKMWCWVSFGVTVAFLLIAILIGLVGELSSY